MRSVSLAAALAMSVPFQVDASGVAILDVEADFDVAAIESVPAARFWQGLGPDLEEAILSRAEEGPGARRVSIAIDLDETAISDSFQSALGAQSLLRGTVLVRSADDAPGYDAFDLSVTVKQAGTAGYGHASMEILTVPSEQIYQLMLKTFADGVLARLR